ncbi:MAG: hypothetical protein Q8N26_03810 [Myxococcales bacterium]|nr:hypothetical protein [Myxococcales bacterium]
MTVQACQRCGTTAPVDSIICPKCHALFHAEKLTTLLRETNQLEADADLVGALGKLREMEPLLPRSSTQALQVRQRIATLEPKAPRAARKGSGGQGWLAGLGAVLIAVLGKGKFLLAGLTKLPTLLTFFVSASLWRDGSTGFALAFVVLGSIYVHEMGHTWAFRRYGIAVSAPMFVPGFGAFVRGTHYPASPTAAGDVALSGPVWGGVSGVLTLLVGVATKEPWVLGAAVLIAEINLFNLFPVWQLDGSRATQCLSKTQVVVLALVGLIGGAVAGSPMSLLAGAGLAVRRFVRAPEGEGDTRTFTVFVSLFVGLLVLRAGAHFLMPT